MATPHSSQNKTSYKDKAITNQMHFRSRKLKQNKKIVYYKQVNIATTAPETTPGIACIKIANVQSRLLNHNVNWKKSQTNAQKIWRVFLRICKNSQPSLNIIFLAQWTEDVVTNGIWNNDDSLTLYIDMNKSIIYNNATD